MKYPAGQPVPSDGDYIVVVVVVVGDADAATPLCLQGVGRNCSRL
jgi:hypothetical protein